MTKFICCDCNEQKDTENALESHISKDHLHWIPYECIYCRDVDLHIYKATEADLKAHFDIIHPEKQFTILYMTDEENKMKLMEKMERSKLHSNMQTVIDGKNAEPALKEEAGKHHPPSVSPSVDLVASPDYPGSTVENVEAEPLVISSPKCAREWTLERKGFTCCHCLQKFRWIGQMKIHQDDMHCMDGEFRCSQCYKKFHNWSAYRAHHKSHFTLTKKSWRHPHKNSSGGQMEREEISTVNLPEQQGVDDMNMEEEKEEEEVSGNKRQVYFCVKCQKSVESYYVNPHLAIHHFDKVMISCGACSHGTKWFIKDMKLHIKKAHKRKNVKIIDNRPKFKAELQLLKNQLMKWQNTEAETLKYCLKCEKWVSIGGITKHIIDLHLNQITLHCSQCSHGMNHRSTLLKHVKTQHKNARIIDNRPKFQKQVRKLRNEIIVSAKPTFEEEPVRKSLPAAVSPDRTEAVLDDDSVSATAAIEVEVSTIPKKYCSKCQCTVAGDKIYRHLAENHLKKMLVKCSLCDFGTFWGTGQVYKHIKNEHKGPKVEVVNERRKYERQLKAIKKMIIVDRN